MEPENMPKGQSYILFEQQGRLTRSASHQRHARAAATRSTYRDSRFCRKITDYSVQSSHQRRRPMTFNCVRTVDGETVRCDAD